MNILCQQEDLDENLYGPAIGKERKTEIQTQQAGLHLPLLSFFLIFLGDFSGTPLAYVLRSRRIYDHNFIRSVLAGTPTPR